MRFNDIFYNKLNLSFRKPKKTMAFILESNSYVAPLHDIMISEYPKVSDTFELFSSEEKYEPLIQQEAFNIVGNKLRKIDNNLYNTYMNIINDKEKITIIEEEKINEKTKTVDGSSVYGDKMTLYLKNTSFDVSLIAHEIMHVIFNQRIQKMDDSSDIVKLLFSEVNSILFESVINEELELDKDVFLKERFHSDLSKSIYYKFCYFMYTTYLKYGHIDNDVVMRELTAMKDENLKQIFLKYGGKLAKVLISRVDLLEYDLFTFSGYVVGSVLSKTIYKKIVDNEITYEEYFKRVQELKEIDRYTDGLSVLDVNYIYKKSINDELKNNYDEFCDTILGARKR